MKNKNLIIGIGALALFYLLFIKKTKKTKQISVLDKWKQNIDSKNLDGIVNTYSPKAILVSTLVQITSNGITIGVILLSLTSSVIASNFILS